jgi:hypothetical protein
MENGMRQGRGLPIAPKASVFPPAECDVESRQKSKTPLAIAWAEWEDYPD